MFDVVIGVLIDQVLLWIMILGMVMLCGLQVLYFGNFGYEVVKWLYFIFGLVGVFLFYSGNLLWIEFWCKWWQFEQLWCMCVMVVLILGVCLGCIVGVLVVFVVGVLVLGWGWLIYYLVFGVCLLWVCLCQFVCVGYELLCLCVLMIVLVLFVGWVGNGELLFVVMW